MGAWAYCTNDDCNQPIQRDDYSIEDICNQNYTCPSCGEEQGVAHTSLAEKLQEMEDRIKNLEETMLDLLKKLGE